MYHTNLRRLKIIPSIFPDHNGIKLPPWKTSIAEGKWGNSQARGNNTLLNNQWVTEEVKREIRNYLERNENKNTTSETYGMQQKQ